MKKYALLIGNSQFAEDSGLSPLKYTKHDVYRLESVLLPTYDCVIPVVNENRWQILAEIQGVVDRLKPNDLLLIYYSGHGETFADSKLFLAASNTKKKQLTATGVDYDDILLILKNHYCENVLIILDCCYSGMADVISRGEEEAPPLGDVVSLSSGVCLMTASSAHEVAKERADYQGGTFTHYLIQGLQQGIGIHHPDGIIRPQDLYEYAFKSIKNKGYEQTPHIKSSMTGVLPFFTQDLPKTDRLGDIKDRLLFAQDQTRLKEIIEDLESYLQQNPGSEKAQQLKYKAQQMWLERQPKPEPKPQKPESEPKPQTESIPKPEKKSPPKETTHRQNTENKKGTRPDLKFKKPLLITVPFVLGFMLYFGSRDKDSASGTDLFPTMTLIKGGTYKMGCQPSDTSCDDDEKPLHSVTVKDFYLSTTEVTFEQYDHYCESVSWFISYFCKPDDEGWGRGKRPVINVSWIDAKAYIQWLNGQPGKKGYRLPTEAEWEYAVRAGTTTKYSWGNSPSGKHANGYSPDGRETDLWPKDGFEHTAPVASYQPNPWGLYDMSGNVWEWCEDKWHSNYEGAPTDGTAWVAGDEGARVLRGGSWYDSTRYLRSSYRGDRAPSVRNISVGFRVAQVF